jgi:tRNA A-37 threonylcarbamoyl transferase component Bud32
MIPDDGSMLSPGARVASRYVIESLVATGGMSVVFRARDERLGQSIALKVLRRPNNAREAARFVREARTIARLRSEHVVRVLDVDASADPPFLAMELLEGCDVAQLLRAHGRLSVDVALKIVIEACRGVAEAHAVGVVHRDLKPSNLLLATLPDGSQCVKVIDFGISKLLTQDGAAIDLTTSGQILGSPRYMSPEQVRGGKVDARSDVWALGAILYELSAGVAPFDGATVADTLARIVADTPAPLRTLVPEVPERLASILSMCLEKDVALRPPSVRALLDELEAIAPAGPIAIDVPKRDVQGAASTAAEGSTEAARDRAWSVSHSRAQTRNARSRRAIAAASLCVAIGLGWLGLRARGHAGNAKGAAPQEVSAPVAVDTRAPESRAIEPSRTPPEAVTPAQPSMAIAQGSEQRPRALVAQRPVIRRGATSSQAKASPDAGRADDALDLDRRE